MMDAKVILSIGLYVAQFLPSLVVCILFIHLCRERKTVLWFMAAGTFLGFLLAPLIESVRENQIWLDDFLDSRIIGAWYTGIGTLAGGLMAFTVDRWRRRRQ
jgi:hypothetical protein